MTKMIKTQTDNELLESLQDLQDDLYCAKEGDGSGSARIDRLESKIEAIYSEIERRKLAHQ